MMSSFAMNDAVESFETHRKLLFGIAYRMLGSASEAEDMVQETFLRWRATPNQAGIDSPRAWLSTAVTRLCLDQIKSARSKRETYIGPWLPEPVTTAPSPPDVESLSLAFMVLLESLTPSERAAYLLHDVFEYSHSEVAGMLEKEEAACRQLVHRARTHLVDRRPRYSPTPEEHQAMLMRFLQAVTQGDLSELTAMLAQDAVAYSDGGGKVNAARNVIQGAQPIAKLFAGLMKKGGMPVNAVHEFAFVNGVPTMVTRVEGRTIMVFSIETDGSAIYAVHVILNPDKLARM